MGRPLNFRDRKVRLFFEMGEAFGQVRTLESLHDCAEHYLLRLCQADHVAVCMALPAQPMLYEWKTRTLCGLLRDYPEWAPDDFVGGTVIRCPNRALSDVQMLRGGKVEDTETWRRSHASGLRLRHVLSAAVVPGRGGGHGGVTLYSERRKPFSAEQLYILDWFMPSLQRAFLDITRPAESGLLREDWSRLLTDRQREVANLFLSQGGSNQDLADELGIKKNTVKEHMKAIARVTGAESRNDLMARGRRPD